MVMRSGGNADSMTAVRNTKSRFDFFNDFYSLDELTNFNNFIINYSSGQDDILSREFNYFNHLGIIQKWMTYFMNYLYPELFKDYKQYINTHLKQTISNSIKKKPFVFSMTPKKKQQTQYSWQKAHLFFVLKKILGNDEREYNYASEIVNSLEAIPARFFVGYTEIKVSPKKMSKNFLDKLMKSLDESTQNKEKYSFSHKDFLNVKYNGIT